MDFRPESVPFIFIGIIILVGNAFVCILYSKHAVLQTVTNKFVISVAVCDMMIALIFIPLYILSKDISSYVAALSSFGSLFNLLALSYERHIAIFHALRYYSIMSQLKVRLLMIEVWITTAIITLFPLPWELSLSRADYLRWHRIYSGILTTIIIIVISFTLIVYARIFRVNRKHIQREKNLTLVRRLSDTPSKKKATNHVLRRLFMKSSQPRTECKGKQPGMNSVFDGSIPAPTHFSSRMKENRDASNVVEINGYKICRIDKNISQTLVEETIIDNGCVDKSRFDESLANNRSDDRLLVQAQSKTIAKDDAKFLNSVDDFDDPAKRDRALTSSEENVKRSLQQKAQVAINILREIKAAKIIALIFILNCLCWLPIIIINICDVVSSNGHAAFIKPEFLRASLYLFVLNSLLNPFIYAICKKDFRKVIARRIRMMELRVGS